jgi:hypothetical protein
MGTATDKVIDQIIEHRTTFERFCYSLSEEQLNRPVPESTWIVRDFAAHLATLDPIMEEMFTATAAGGRLPDGPDGKPFDLDQFNDALVAERREWPLARVFEEGAANRVRLIEALRGITDEQTQLMMYFAGDSKRAEGNIPFGLFLSGWAWHDPIHAFDMMRALPELAGDADLQAWTDNVFVKGYQAAMNHA